MWRINLSSAPLYINSSSLEDILSAISQPTIFITFLCKAWIFGMSCIHSSSLTEGSSKAVSIHFKSPKPLFYFSFIPTLCRLQQTTPRDYCAKWLISTVPPFYVAMHSHSSVNLCREQRERNLLPPVHQHTTGAKTRHQGDRQVLHHLLDQGCWGAEGRCTGQ